MLLLSIPIIIDPLRTWCLGYLTRMDEWFYSWVRILILQKDSTKS